MANDVAETIVDEGPVEKLKKKKALADQRVRRLAQENREDAVQIKIGRRKSRYLERHSEALRWFAGKYLGGDRECYYSLDKDEMNALAEIFKGHSLGYTAKLLLFLAGGALGISYLTEFSGWYHTLWLFYVSGAVVGSLMVDKRNDCLRWDYRLKFPFIHMMNRRLNGK